MEEGENGGGGCEGRMEGRWEVEEGCVRGGWRRGDVRGGWRKDERWRRGM